MNLGISRARGSALGLRLFACLLAITAASAALGEDLLPGTPGKNVNIIGPTPDSNHVPDILLRQQNEPACTIRPGSPAYIFCAYNDYRATDFPLIQGDSWIGVSMSADFGKTWFSRLTPGFLGHANSLNLQFAADPNVVSVPGNSPGIVILNYIAASRDLNDGIMAIQRWAEMPKEDVNYYLAENKIVAADITNNGRFADKPAMIAMLDEGNKQTTLTISMQLEDGSMVDRDVASGTLVLCYSVFTGSNSSKVICKTSPDWGDTWSKDIKISEEQVRVQGVSLTNIGNMLVAAWRRADSNKGIGNSVVTAVSVNGGRTWSKGLEATDLCPIDQQATGSQIRMLDFPVIANDGELVYVFAADRRFAGDQSCATGIPKIAMTYSDDGVDWSPLQALDADGPSPFGEPTGDGYQYIPSAFGYRGNVRVAFYDTRRETLAGPLPANLPPEMKDYVATDGTIVNRKADVYTVKVRRDKYGVPQISPAVRVSRYNTVIFDKNGVPFPVPLETEAHFPNTPIFVQGTRAFNGDYTATAASAFRIDEPSNKWIQNSLTTGNILTDREDVFVAWGDTRDLRGNFLPKFDGSASPFTPNNDAQEMPFETVGELQQKAEEDTRQLLAENNLPSDADSNAESTLTAESVDDDPVAMGSGTCEIGQDKTRDANVYGSLIRSVTDFSALTTSKPLTGFQRTYPFVITNPEELLTRTFRLRIVDQPADFGPDGSPVAFTGQASWHQLPSKPPFTADSVVDEVMVSVPPKSAAARTMFLVTNDTNALIRVKLYDAGCVPEAPDCPALKTVVVGEGDLLDSEFCENNPGAGACALVANAETHDPLLLTNPDLVAPDLVAPRLLSPDLVAPDLVAPDLVAPDLVAPDLVAPDLVAPDLVAPDLVAPDLVAPDLVAPDLVASAPAYQDITYTLQASGNVTTTYSTDMSFDTQGLDITAQLIVWTAYVTGTSHDCAYALVADNQVLASKALTDTELQSITLPTVQDPFAGPLSFAARPGQFINVTLRVFGELAVLQTLQPEDFIASTGFGASAHSCNDLDPDGNDTSTIDPTIDCLTINTEKIIVDKTPPVFNVDPNMTIFVEADREDGGVLDPASGAVTATDDGEPVGVLCTELTTNTVLTGVQVFPLGSYDVGCDAGDAAGNLASIELPVEIQDTVAPVVVLLGNALETVEGGDAYIDAGATASDQRDLISVDLTSLITVETTLQVGGGAPTPVAGVDTFVIGTYVLTYTVIDAGGNPDSITRTVIVSDTTAPALSLPGDFVGVPGNILGGASVSWAATANDVVEGDLLVTCKDVDSNAVITSPHIFATGPTTVSCSATDLSGNTASGSFSVTVVDSISPVVSAVADISGVEATGTNGATASWMVTASDVVDGDLLVTCKDAGTDTIITSPHIFALGITTVSCSATDSSGNPGETTFTVEVVDTTPPDFTTVPATPVLVPVDSSGTGSLNFEAQVAVTDIADLDPGVACVATGGAATGAVSGDPLPIGDTEVTCTATDASGNEATANYTVRVEYGSSFGIDFSKKVVKAGSSAPSTFGWLDSAKNRVDSSDADPVVTARTCDSNLVVLNPGEFPGNSDLRYDASMKEWKFNWQTVFNDGSPIPGTIYCVQVISQKTLQTIPDNGGFTQIKVRD